jgi:putative transcriptional regulator
MTEAPLHGRLVVAAPTLRDPNFERTVVLVLEHGAQGALGVVLNRPSDTGLLSAIPRWDALATPPAVVFSGGPVAPSAAICLGRATGAGVTDGWRPLFHGLCTVDLDRDPTELGTPPADIRVFAGYAGWGPSQLEGEIEVGAWYVVDALPGDALSASPAGLWADVLRRQGGSLAVLANFPPDPTMN